MSEGDQQFIEQQVADLERQLQAKREELSRQHQEGQITELPHEKETLREVVGERIGELPESVEDTNLDEEQPVEVLPPPVVDSPSYLNEDLKLKVQELVNVAFTKSIDAAIEQARASGNAALIDAFHDALVDELYSYLVERGKLKQL